MPYCYSTLCVLLDKQLLILFGILIWLRQIPDLPSRFSLAYDMHWGEFILVPKCPFAQSSGLKSAVAVVGVILGKLELRFNQNQFHFLALQVQVEIRLSM